MPTIEAIRQNLPSVIERDDERNLCLRLIDEIALHLPPPRGSWTYEVLSKWVGAKASDELFQDCVNLLATAPSIKALDLNFMVFDPSVPDDIGVRIENERMEQFLRAGRNAVFLHPITGEEVPDPWQNIVSYFTPALELREGGEQ